MTVGEIIEKCMPPRCVRWRYSSHESLRLCVCVDCHDFASRVDYVKCLSTSYSRVRGFLERRRITAVAHLCRFPTSSISLCGKRVARRAAILSSDSPCSAPVYLPSTRRAYTSPCSRGHFACAGSQRNPGRDHVEHTIFAVINCDGCA